MTSQTTDVLIGLGSNQGDSVQIVQQAADRLRAFAVDDEVAVSRFWRTSPVDCPPDSGDFINAVARFTPLADLAPEELLRKLKQLEREFGRGAAYVKNAPRALDLDLLVFGDERRYTAEFTLPHPRAIDRMFVLAPAAEVAAEIQWPGTQQTVEQLLAELETDEVVAPL